MSEALVEEIVAVQHFVLSGRDERLPVRVSRSARLA
jgi:hypothetical protein